MTNTSVDPGVLAGIAALGLTLTGFSGLVAVLGSRGAGRWTKGELFQFIEMITVSLAVTFMAFVPILASTIFSDQVGLRVSNGVIAGVHAVLLVRGVRKVVMDPEARRAFARGVLKFLTGGGILTITAGLASALGLINTQSFTILLNLLWMFFVATVQFVQLLSKHWEIDDA